MPKISLSCLPMLICAASLLADLVHTAILLFFGLTFTTMPQISSPSSNCSPMHASTACSQFVSSNWEFPLARIAVHLPPCSQVGSSHLGSTPSLNRCRSDMLESRDGGMMLLYRHQKSSTVSKVYTARSVWPHCDWDCFCLPSGLSNHRVHFDSRGCFCVKSGSAVAGSNSLFATSVAMCILLLRCYLPYLFVYLNLVGQK
mmetsp:Transcript_10376/g.28298  ORF Transcript_10376/g.28298 Transcript_10376/m.28298 type:complete len:201 (-) Transcript_10376:563-1165(-)